MSVAGRVNGCVHEGRRSRLRRKPRRPTDSAACSEARQAQSAGRGNSKRQNLNPSVPRPQLQPPTTGAASRQHVEPTTAPGLPPCEVPESCIDPSSSDEGGAQGTPPSLPPEPLYGAIVAKRYTPVRSPNTQLSWAAAAAGQLAEDVKPGAVVALVVTPTMPLKSLPDGVRVPPMTGLTMFEESHENDPVRQREPPLATNVKSSPTPQRLTSPRPTVRRARSRLRPQSEEPAACSSVSASCNASLEAMRRSSRSPP